MNLAINRIPDAVARECCSSGELAALEDSNDSSCARSVRGDPVPADTQYATIRYRAFDTPATVTERGEL